MVRKKSLKEGFKTKKEFLDYLQNKHGDFEVAVAEKKGEDIFWSKWQKYSVVRDNYTLLERMNNRTIFDNEVVLDFDEKVDLSDDNNKYFKLLEKLERDGLKFQAYSADGNANHIHLIFSDLRIFSKEKREKFKEYLIKKYNCDLMKKSGRCMIALEDVSHWKHKLPKKLIKEVSGVNSEIDLVREMLTEAKTKLINYSKSDDKRKSQADRIIEMIDDEDIEFFHDQYKDTFAAIEVNDHQEIWPLKSRNFKRFLSRLFYVTESKAPATNAIASALGVLEGRAVFEGKLYKLHNRVARVGNTIYYDLTNEKWQAAKIDEKGWEIVDKPPILFRRYAHQAPQVLPDKTHNLYLHELMRYINLQDKDSKLLIIVYTVTALVPDIPHVIPILYGAQGSAKSTLFKMIKMLIDPSVIELLTFPRDTKEMVQKLSHHWAAFFDNVTILPDWLSDTLCRAVTGDGFSKRELFTDDDDIIYSFIRCVGLNGISVAANKPDLLDRGMMIKMESISKGQRKQERKLRQQFERVRPALLAALFTAVSDMMRIQSELKLEGSLPRMADFALYGEAAARGLDYSPGEFLRVYNKNIGLQTVQAIEAEIIGPVIVEFMKTRECWEGTPTELKAELDVVAIAMKVDVRAKAYPKAANALSRRIAALQATLKEVGINIATTQTSTQRKIKISRTTVNSDNIVNTDDKKEDKSNDINDINDDFVNIHPDVYKVDKTHLPCSICGLEGDGCTLEYRGKPICDLCTESIKRNQRGGNHG